MRRLGIGDAVEFAGTQPNDVVAGEMRRGVGAFVQHSLVGADGNSEGMPVAILEGGGKRPSGGVDATRRHSGGRG